MNLFPIDIKPHAIIIISLTKTSQIFALSIVLCDIQKMDYGCLVS